MIEIKKGIDEFISLHLINCKVNPQLEIKIILHLDKFSFLKI